MKEYLKPVLECVTFAAEAITSGPEFGTEDGSVEMDV